HAGGGRRRGRGWLRVPGVPADDAAEGGALMDTLQLVTFSAGGRPVLVSDFQDGVSTLLVQRSLTFQPGQKTAQMSQRQRRYGGAFQVGETTDNGQLAWQWLVKGASADLASQAV